MLICRVSDDLVQSKFASATLRYCDCNIRHFEDVKNFIELCFAVFPSFLLIVSNLYLVMCIAFIMATSSTTLDLVQNFIAVEILVQAHSMIAKLMRIRDRSPERFSKHWRLTLHELEKVKALPIYMKNKDGTDGLRARLSYQRFNNIIFR